MAKVRPDFSFVREGRPLSAWLTDLVADDRPTREKAGDVLQGMSFGVAYAHTELSDLDWEEYDRDSGQSERFAAAVRDAVARPEFPTADFVRRLILYRMAIHDEWLRRADESRRRSEAEPDEYVKRIGRRLEAAGDDAERAEAAKRLCRWFRATLSRGMKADGEIFAGAEAMSPAGLASYIIFTALDVALLADRPGLRLMLDRDSSQRGDALEALERIGPPAADFAPGLLASLDAQTADSWFDAARALGSIGRDDPAVVDALITRLGSRSETARAGAARCLARAGPPLAGRADEAADLLMERARQPNTWGTVEALAAVGAGREDVLDFILEMASPKPPRWIPLEYHPGRVDEVMYERGEAIVALRHFPAFADRIVPTLIEAMDSFEEYDPDWSHDGAHERVCRTLAALGPGAAPATGPLVVYLEGHLKRRGAATEDTDDWPKTVFDALAGIGPAAAAALPVLEALRRYEWDEDPPPPLDRDVELDRAILAIRGEIDRPTFPPAGR